jgi:hypothetical protein
MERNCVISFATAICGVVAVFLFSIVVSAPQAHAYAVGSVPTNVTPGAIATAGAGAGYDIGGSLQNLISPFTGFINSLKFNNNGTTNPSGMSTGMNSASFTWPTVNLTPVLESTVQSTLSQWISEFDNWLYSVTGVQLSGIMAAILGVFLWALRLAQQVVNWLLGLFH